MRGEVLDHRALNRALLARQLLLERSPADPLTAVEHLVGLQSQNPMDAYVGLWSRLRGFRPESLAGLMTGRDVVRIALMRSTIHLVSARDCRALRPLIQPVLDRSAQGQFGRRLAGVDRGELAAAGREMVEGRAATIGEIGSELTQRWPGVDPLVLGLAVRSLVPLVQVPPRGVWGARGRAAHTSAESWLGGPLDESPEVDALVARYLGAFGPASVADAQRWSGLTGLGVVFERLRAGLRTFRDERGKELFDLPDAPRPDAGTPAPVRFLPVFDNVLLGHADRSRLAAGGRWDPTDPHTGTAVIGQGTFLVDGFLRGVWRTETGGAVLSVRPFTPLATGECEAVVAEAGRLGSFLSPAAPPGIAVNSAEAGKDG